VEGAGSKRGVERRGEEAASERKGQTRERIYSLRGERKTRGEEAQKKRGAGRIGRIWRNL
jgi:hypothetical protein